MSVVLFFFFQAEDGIRDLTVTGVQTCALPISTFWKDSARAPGSSTRWPRVAGTTRRADPDRCAAAPVDRKSVVKGKSVDLGGRRIIKKKKRRRRHET